jgi:ABC-2 type transport system ATP-binding protein
MPEDIVLETFDLGKRYGSRWAVDGLGIRIARGEVFGFLGPNGAGKSTTIRMLLSLVRPTTGRIEFFGQPLSDHREGILARIGGLVERPDFYLYLSARRNLEIIATLIGGVKTGAIDEALSTVGLLGRAGDKVKTYSHGMKQRLGIAQALLGEPEFVILDEPTLGLDPQGIKEVRELIRRLSAERSMTVLLSSHLLNEIEQTATSMAIINSGRLVVQGNVRELLAAEENSYRIEARPLQQALSIISGHPGVSAARIEGEAVNCSMDRGTVSSVNRALVLAGIDVQAIAPRKSLEEYFLALTNDSRERAVTFPDALKRRP